MLLVQAQAYRQQYGFKAIYLLPVNLYGPRDNFDPQGSHVIPALIKKCVEARDSGAGEIVVWGDGSPTREFLYVEDAAEGIVLASERYDKPDPVNLGSAFEISIRDLVTLIAEATRFTGKITWDTSQPNGQPRRKLDTSRAEREFGFRSRTDFREGLKRTVEWYERQRNSRAPNRPADRRLQRDFDRASLRGARQASAILFRRRQVHDMANQQILEDAVQSGGVVAERADFRKEQRLLQEHAVAERLHDRRQIEMDRGHRSTSRRKKSHG